MATITFTIPNAKLQRVKDGILKVYPNNEADSNGDPRYTDNEWLKEAIRRFIITSVKKGEKMMLEDTLKTDYATQIASLPETDSTVS